MFLGLDETKDVVLDYPVLKKNLMYFGKYQSNFITAAFWSKIALKYLLISAVY